MRKNMSELSPKSGLRLLIILNDADMTLRLNTPEREPCERRREKRRACPLLGASRHLKAQEKVIQLGELVGVLETLVKGAANSQRRTTGIRRV